MRSVVDRKVVMRRIAVLGAARDANRKKDIIVYLKTLSLLSRLYNLI